MWRSLKCSLKPSLGNHRGFPHKVNYFFKSSKLRNMTNKTQLVYPNTSQNKTPTDTVCCSFACRVPAWSPVKPCVFMYFFATLSQKVGLDPNTPQKVNTTHHHSPSFIKKIPAIHSSMKVLMVLKGQTCSRASGAAPSIAPSACGVCGVAGSSTTLLVSKVPLEQQSKRTSDGGEGEDGDDFAGFRWVKQCHLHHPPSKSPFL